MKTLIIDPDPESRDLLRRAFQAAGEQVRGVASVSEGNGLLPELLPDIVVASLDPSGEALAFLLDAVAVDSRRASYAVVDRGRLEEGTLAMSRGVRDFLWRPVEPARVAVLLAQLAQRRARDVHAEQLRLALARKEFAESLQGCSASWKATLSTIEREAALEAPVLLTGEPGTEKEEAARSLHNLSRRGAEPFRLMRDVTDGSWASAPNGTLFIPAIEAIEGSAQHDLVALLDRPLAPRVIVSSDEKPEDAVAAGRLLAPLLESLRDHVVHLPPLRERREDVERLARRILTEVDPWLMFDAEAMDALSAHDWPGNVAELERVVRRASRLVDGSTIGPTVVFSVLGGAAMKRRMRRRRPPVVRVPVGASLADVERRLIQKTLEFVRGNKPKAAELLKLSLKTIYNKIKEYGLEH